MRRLWLPIVSLAALFTTAGAKAQSPAVVPADPYRLNGWFAAPGLYGMSYGSPSYGVPRTYTAFSSPYGPGYGYGYAPYGMLPGRYGVGLWRPGFVAPGYAYGASYYYGTFPVPYTGNPNAVTAPVGAYAPAFGPPSFYGW
jgi:hypothetical protein